jgi:hypothetical protein
VIEEDPQDATRVQLSPDEAVVLSEMLWRWRMNADDSGHISVEHSAERIVLAEINSMLEKQLVSPFKSNWPEILEAARIRIAARWLDE